MNKKDLIVEVAKNTEYEKEEVTDIVDATLDAIVDALKEGDRVQLLGFGTFYTLVRPERLYKTSFNKEAKVTPETVMPKFKPGSALKRAVKK